MTAGIQASGLLTQQPRHQPLSQRALADAGRPVQQISMGMLRAPRQLLPK